MLVQPNGQITVKLALKWTVNVIEFSRDRLRDKKLVARLNRHLSKEMADLAQKTLRKMQEARFDGLGIGRQLMVFHPDTWEKQKEDWGSNYQKVRFAPEIRLEITREGIIN
ncbi:Ger(x)C family spore germination C-terminal domain-containing protein [Brevibacillus ruminantium]|uniref:Ger(X)C family spore germination C-terminal domain-containing protein n=1 Tax=Brevibacillus ruminantium TaxID=2950604 RepID=A0ABY4WM71_9BACL|nr:Ger(x)C family spore germination C-terminal domain-containing protein [Brevibacillus ruminantium]USG68256.1 Ger(x)C family spore germination C-terminal domain-containing protein [Brevibacillus ruminantium]